MTAPTAIGVGAGSDVLEANSRAATSTIARAIVRHLDLVVVHPTDSPWVSTHDDGKALVVLDGRLHHPTVPAAEQARDVAERFARDGVNFASGLLGDFVVIVLDRVRNRLLVARDPLGVRPWYVGTTRGGFVGASDFGLVASLPEVDTSIDETAAVEYFAAVIQSRGPTLYRGIETLKPGSTWDYHDGTARTSLHHRWALRSDLEISWDDAAERCRSVLDLAVAARLASGGPATSELSGGLDSSAVVGTVVGLGHDDLLVGRLVFEGLVADERRYSDAVVDHWGIPAVSADPWIPNGDEAAELTRELRRPIPDPHFTMFRSLHRELAARRRFDGLTGLGGDDAFVSTSVGGRVISAAQTRDRRILTQVLRRAVFHPRHAWPNLLRPTLHHLAPRRHAVRPPWVSERAHVASGLDELLRASPEKVTGVAAIDERIANLTGGHDAALLELRAAVADPLGRRDSHPYLDPRFIEATYGLDPWWPSAGDHTRALQVAAYADRLPSVVAERHSKAGFAEVFWPHLLDAAAIESVTRGPLVELGWLDASGFDGIVDRAKRGMANAAIPLSRCVSVDHWLRSR